MNSNKIAIKKAFEKIKNVNLNSFQEQAKLDSLP